jgi:hypothetical protein
VRSAPVDVIRKAIMLRAEGRTYREVGEIVGFHRTAVWQWVKRHEGDPSWPQERQWDVLDVPRHGRHGYYAGCRCEACRDAMAALQRQWEKRRYLFGPTMIDRTGSRRRVEALMVIGWTQQHIADAAGITLPVVQNMHTKRTYVHRETAEKIATAYDKLSMRLGPNMHTAAVARNRGYAPPLAWDDDEIDDPCATPHMPGVGRGQGNTRLPEPNLLAAMVNDTNAKLVAARYGVDRKTVQVRLRRAGYRAVQVGAYDFRYVKEAA